MKPLTERQKQILEVMKQEATPKGGFRPENVYKKIGITKENMNYFLGELQRKKWIKRLGSGDYKII